MLYPTKGSMANGSLRTPAFRPIAAAVTSEPTTDPINVPCAQLMAWYTSGMVLGRRPPKRIAEIGTPFGSSQAGSIQGHWNAGAVKRAFGCAAGLPEALS